jgi:hypothetical protein
MKQTCKVPIVFCDSGGFTKEIRRLHRAGTIVAKQGLYEDRAKKADIARPSMWTFDNTHITFDLTEFSFSDGYSPKHAEIVKIIGSNSTRIDALQLDSAYISKAAAFTTSDKRDIVAHRAKLEPLLGIRIFYLPDERSDFLDWVAGYGTSDA